VIVVPVAALLLAAVRPRHGDESRRSPTPTCSLESCS
jgi:hypothetical protein